MQAVVQEVRVQKGFSQAQLAQRVGVDQSQISRIESGKISPSLAMLDKIADALGVKPIKLIKN